MLVSKSAPETAAAPFLEKVYAQINSALGGDNPNQFLCLTIPGQALAAKMYIYDEMGVKPPSIAANESLLVNKMFDPVKVTGADNGRSLPTQYRTALDMLTPKLNKKIAEAKNELRELLMANFPYDFGDGNGTVRSTLQEVFFRLYDDLVAAKREWAKLQDDNLKRIRLQDKEHPENVDDDYWTWYETYAESEIETINEKAAKVMSVFSANDMRILEGILDSGSGAELEDARLTLDNTRRLAPNGGYVYPVSLYPQNWAKDYLGTSFTPIDLLESPAVLSEKLLAMNSQRARLAARIAELSALVPDNDVVQAAKTALVDAQAARNSASQELIQAYGDGITTVLNTVAVIAPAFAAGGGVPLSILDKVAEQNGVAKSDTLMGHVTGALVDTTNKQTVYNDAAQAYSNALFNSEEVKNNANLANLILPMKSQLEEFDMKISDIKTKLTLAAALSAKADAQGNVSDPNVKRDAEGKVISNESDLMPPETPNGFTQVIITADSTEMHTATDSGSSAGSSSYGGNFFFCGAKHSADSASSTFETSTQQGAMSIQIGMNVAKVGIERSWFNPGVFAMSEDMFNVTTLNFAPTKDYNEMNGQRMLDMANKIFPCFPVAFVIARDVTIKLSTNTSFSSSFSDSVSSHASTGGGFLFFSGSSSSSSAESHSGASVATTDNSVTIKFATPQILGYYLQATPADKSSKLDEVRSAEALNGYVTISDFVESYKKMLADMANNKLEVR